ncbi:MAG: glycosyltransferase family 39 protein [Parcubacteria group bacterium]|jgi:4-amino-4-deoxy-L-arabinose transferase-like glycosyltransferase
MKQKNLIALTVIFFVFTINIAFGLPRLSQYSSVDEPYWTYDRTPDFWRAIANKKWKNTDINDKPGITVAEISGLGLLSGIDPLKLKSVRQETKSPEVVAEFIKINFFLRLPIYLACLLILGAFYFFLRKLLNHSIALLSLILIGLSPIILGISLIINPDSLLWGFLPLSIITFLIYQKESARRYLIFSGIFLGLSLLTKYVANILYVYMLGLIFLEYIYAKKSDGNFSAYLKKSLLDYAILILVSLIVFFILYPAAWVKPKMVLEGTIWSAAFKTTWPFFVGFIGLLLADLFLLRARLSSGVMNFLSKYSRHFKIAIGSIFLAGIAFVLLNTYAGMQIFDFEKEMASPKGENIITLGHILKITTADLYALLFGLTPIVFLLFIFSILKNTFQKGTIQKEAMVVSYFLIFILIYYVASTVNQVTATVRYQIVVYPLAMIIAAIGVQQLIQSEKIKKYAENGLIYVLLIFISAVSLLSSHPFFFNYSSSLLPEKYILNLKDMGDGSFETADFLNRLPDAKNLIIWSDKGAVCETFVGTCKTSFNKDDTLEFDFDYFVVSAGRKSRSLKMELSADFKDRIDFEKLYSSTLEDAEFEITFGNNPNNFVRVVRTEKIIEQK